MVSFTNVAIVGVGLIGGSLALAARKQGTFQHIVGIDHNFHSIEKAQSLKVVDWGTTDLYRGVKEADLVVVATPVRSIAPLITEIAPIVRPGTIITDVGSVKDEIVSTVEAMRLDDVSFVGGHPIAGTENSGVEAAFTDLFLEKNCVLTPTKRTLTSALERVRQVWESVGAHVVCMDTQVHDRIFGAVSHLPHYVAFALVSCIDNLASAGEDFFRFSAGGLKDFTRIAGSDPVMWTDIACMNRANVVELIDNYQAYLNTLRQLINDGDAEGLLAHISKARSVRRNRINES
jgi:prephenate dehydrogenase